MIKIKGNDFILSGGIANQVREMAKIDGNTPEKTIEAALYSYHQDLMVRALAGGFDEKSKVYAGAKSQDR